MGKFWTGILLILLLAACVFYKYFFDKTIFSKGTISFTVQEFGNNELIPKKFTCEGQDVSPSFLIERVPGDAKSIAIIVDEPEAKPDVVTHYILLNVDPQIGSIEQSITPANTIVATNDFGKQEYNGPCPTLGDHKYSFKVYALDKELEISESAKRNEVDNAMKGHIIARGEYSGTYSKI